MEEQVEVDDSAKKKKKSKPDMIETPAASSRSTSKRRAADSPPPSPLVITLPERIQPQELTSDSVARIRKKRKEVDDVVFAAVTPLVIVVDTPGSTVNDETRKSKREKVRRNLSPSPPPSSQFFKPPTQPEVKVISTPSDDELKNIKDSEFRPLRRSLLEDIQPQKAPDASEGLLTLEQQVHHVIVPSTAAWFDPSSFPF